jgi:hypothetical protein
MLPSAEDSDERRLDMSQITGRVGEYTPFQSSPPPHVGPEVELTPQAIEALVARARDVIAQKSPGPALVIPKHVEEFSAQQIASFPFVPDPKVMQHMKEQASLQANYQGELVAVIRDKNDDLAVLAVGSREVFAMLDGLSDEERSKILVTDTN